MLSFNGIINFFDILRLCYFVCTIILFIGVWQYLTISYSKEHPTSIELTQSNLFLPVSVNLAFSPVKVEYWKNRYIFLSLRTRNLSHKLRDCFVAYVPRNDKKLYICCWLLVVGKQICYKTQSTSHKPPTTRHKIIQQSRWPVIQSMRLLRRSAGGGTPHNDK